MKKIMVRVLLVVWVVLWVMFVARELFFKGGLRDYRILIGRDLEGKHAYVTGDDLYGFIAFCRENIPDRATYAFEGFEEGALDTRRATYYLYPRMEKPDPDFICVYMLPDRPRAGYGLFKKRGDTGYILKKGKE